LVNPNVKGREKLLLYFFTFNTDTSHSIQEWEQLGAILARDLRNEGHGRPPPRCNRRVPRAGIQSKKLVAFPLV